MKKIAGRCQSPSEEPGVGCSGDTFTVSCEETIVWYKEKFKECGQRLYLADVDRMDLGWVFFDVNGGGSFPQALLHSDDHIDTAGESICCRPCHVLHGDNKYEGVLLLRIQVIRA